MLRYLVCAIVVAGCGDNVHPPDASQASEVLAKLQTLPGVHDVTAKPTNLPGYTYFVLHFTQPVDHDAPAGGQTFLQEVSLIHKDLAAPLVIQTSGYWDYYLDSPVELTELLGANQISIEHRFFASSRPDPADWSKLTIEQMADDEHAIVTSLRTLYSGPKLATGGSKGGMTAIFYRRFYPSDVDGTVPYVAPISYAAPDPRYLPYLAQVGNATCRAAVRAAAVEMLQNRRSSLVQAATEEAVAKGYSYTRVLIGPAVESAVIGLEWSFWQYFGIDECSQVPDTTASDDDMFQFLDQISPVSSSDDDQTGLFDAYFYQAYFQLGYPDDGTESYLMPYEMYTDADYVNSLPTAMPTYDGGTAMHDIDSFLETQGNRFLFVYGQWDPWSGGMFTLGNATNSALLVEAEGTHNSDLLHLAAADTQTAFDLIQGWTGLVPSVTHSDRVRSPREPQVPSAIRRALRARRKSP
jgi:hypothetical protein